MYVIRTTTFGLPVDAIVGAAVFPQMLDWFCQRGVVRLFTFVNPGALAVARRVGDYPELLAAFDVVFPDGIGMCWAMRLLHGLRPARVSFDTTSLAPAVIKWAVKNRFTVGLVGGRPGVAQKAGDQLVKAYPELAISVTLDGFGDRMSKIAELRRRAPDIVICGMGAGEQERFLVSFAAAGWSGAAFTCGGYLDQLSEGLHYYPAWIDATNLRWAYRILREPRRLARRYLVDYALFAGCLGRAILSGADVVDGTQRLLSVPTRSELTEH